MSEVDEMKLSKEQSRELAAQLANVRDATTNRKTTHMSSAVMRAKLSILAGGQNKVDFAKYEAGFARFQACYRGYKARQSYAKLVRDVAYRDNVAHEMLSTERDYCASLLACIECYLTPLESQAILTAEEMQILFGNIKEVYTTNCPLLKALEDRVNKWYPQQVIGDIMRTVSSFTEPYLRFVENVAQSIKLSQKLAKNEKFIHFTVKCREDPRLKQLDIQSFIIMPVQRVPRYVLLLRDLLKHTWKTHRDFDDLQKALDTIQLVGVSMNEKNRDAENTSLLQDLNSRLSGKICPNLLQEGRTLVRAGVLPVKKSEIHLILLSDILVLGKEAKHKIDVLECLSVSMAELTPDNHNASAGETVNIAVHEFGEEKSLMVVPMKQAEAAMWLSDLKAAKLKLASASSVSLRGETAPCDSPYQKTADEVLSRSTQSGVNPQDCNLEQLLEMKENMQNHILQVSWQQSQQSSSKKEAKLLTKLKESLLTELEHIEGEIQAKSKNSPAPTRPSFTPKAGSAPPSPQIAHSHAAASSPALKAAPPATSPKHLQPTPTAASATPKIATPGQLTKAASSPHIPPTHTPSPSLPPAAVPHAVKHLSLATSAGIVKPATPPPPPPPSAPLPATPTHRARSTTTSSTPPRSFGNSPSPSPPATVAVLMHATSTPVLQSKPVAPSTPTTPKLATSALATKSASAHAPHPPPPRAPPHTPPLTRPPVPPGRQCTAHPPPAKPVPAHFPPGGTPPKQQGALNELGLPVYSYAQLKCKPASLDTNVLENYLAQEEFADKFKMSREQFSKLPSWKKTSLKQQIGLY
eukprot:TRINITY_DN3253_c0_g1_i4.p1 TRINITY_DN3253_c0_g1~~TRINITY_DN3253_c0_g1_i4.p1  ORF type:complete len:809 (-),score=142.90 TRINITY_DN3253_c0_g1_i4:46-2472(-)